MGRQGRASESASLPPQHPAEVWGALEPAVRSARRPRAGVPTAVGRENHRGGRQRARLCPTLALEHQQGAPGHLRAPGGREVQRPPSRRRAAAPVCQRPAWALLPLRDRLQVGICPREAVRPRARRGNRGAGDQRGEGSHSEIAGGFLSRSEVAPRAASSWLAVLVHLARPGRQVTPRVPPDKARATLNARVE